MSLLAEWPGETEIRDRPVVSSLLRLAPAPWYQFLAKASVFFLNGAMPECASLSAAKLQVLLSWGGEVDVANSLPLAESLPLSSEGDGRWRSSFLLCMEMPVASIHRMSGFLSFLWRIIDEKPLGTPRYRGALSSWAKTQDGSQRWA